MRVRGVLAVLLLLPFLLAPVVASLQWWEAGPQLLELPEPAVGVCGRWIVLQHFLYEMTTGQAQPGTGGDPAVALLSCGSEFFVVAGVSGAYVFNRSSGAIEAVFFAGPGETLVGSVNGTVAFYDAAANTVYVKNVMTGSDIAVILSKPAERLSYTLLGGVPVIVYSTPNTTMTGLYDYRVAAPGVDVKLPYTGAGAVLAHGDKLYIESDGLRVLRVAQVGEPPEEVNYIPYPLQITAMYRIVEGQILASAQGTLVALDLARMTFTVYGSNALLSPVGFYQPESNTTYALVNGEFAPVPGYAVAVLDGKAVVTNVRFTGREELVGVIWPVKATVLTVASPLTGTLLLGESALHIELLPGQYRLPRGAVVVAGNTTLLLDSDIELYPPRSTDRERPQQAAPVEYTAARFPSTYTPTLTVSNVNAAYAGGGLLVALRDTEALIVSPQGVLAAIPGVWEAAGAGECVALYTGFSVHLYDRAGNLLTVYPAALPEKPRYMYCGYRDDAPEVLAYLSNTTATINSTGTHIGEAEVPGLLDPASGVLVEAGGPGAGVYYSGAYIPLPANASGVQVSGYQVLWTYNSTLYLLDLAEARAYALVSPPPGSYYPLGNYLARLFAGKLELLPFKSWLAGNCYLQVETIANATVTVDGRIVGVGPTRVYTACGSTVRVEVTAPYHRPANTVVTVDGPTLVQLYPEPETSNVTLRIVAPENVTIRSATAIINGQAITWGNGETIQLQARPYNITFRQFDPDICQPVTVQTTIPPGSYTLTVQCQLAKPVLALYSNVNVTATILTEGTQVATVTVSAGETVYLPVGPGNYTVTAQPLDANFTSFTVNVSVPLRGIVKVNLTPSGPATLVVQAQPADALITVLSSDGVEAARGQGTLNVTLDPGNYTVIVVAPGHLQHVEELRLAPGEKRVITVTLQPAGPAEQPPPPKLWERREVQLGAVAAVLAVAVAALLVKRRKAVAVEEEEG